MAQIGTDARCVDDIEKSELRHKWRVLQEQREGLTNTTGRTNNDNF